MANISTDVNLVINKLTQAKYNELKAAGKIDPNQLYFTTDAALDANNNQVINVADPVVSSDAATKKYVDEGLAAIPALSSSAGTALTYNASTKKLNLYFVEDYLSVNSNNKLTIKTSAIQGLAQAETNNILSSYPTTKTVNNMLTGYATKTYVTNSLTGYAKASDISSKISDSAGVALTYNNTTNKIDVKYDDTYLTVNSSNQLSLKETTVATTTYVDNSLTGYAKTSEVATKSYVDNSVSSSLSECDNRYVFKNANNLVTTDTDQTITGAKSFTGNVTSQHPDPNDYSNNIATTAWVYDAINDVVDPEIEKINGSNIVGQIYIPNVAIAGKFFTPECVVRSSQLDPNRKYNWEIVFANYFTAARTCWIKSSNASTSTNVAVAAGTATVPLVVTAQDPDGPYAYNEIPSMSFNNAAATIYVTLRIYDAGPADPTVTLTFESNN